MPIQLFLSRDISSPGEGKVRWNGQDLYLGSTVSTSWCLWMLVNIGKTQVFSLISHDSLGFSSASRHFARDHSLAACRLYFRYSHGALTHSGSFHPAGQLNTHFRGMKTAGEEQMQEKCQSARRIPRFGQPGGYCVIGAWLSVSQYHPD